jgi:hypothetical protein
MWGDGLRGNRGQQRLERAARDVRAAHRTFHGLLSRFRASPETWLADVGHGECAGEVLWHLTLTGERVCEGLRVASARLPPGPAPARSLNQAAALRILLATWRYPAGHGPLPRTEAQGQVPPPEVVSDRGVRWVADFLELLDTHAPPYLRRVRMTHPHFGPMDPFEWAAWLRIYFRAKELKMDVR